MFCDCIKRRSGLVIDQYERIFKDRSCYWNSLLFTTWPPQPTIVYITITLSCKSQLITFPSSMGKRVTSGQQWSKKVLWTKNNFKTCKKHNGILHLLKLITSTIIMRLRLQTLPTDHDIWKSIRSSGLASFFKTYSLQVAENRCACTNATADPTTPVPHCPICDQTCTPDFRLWSLVWSDSCPY